MILFTLSFLAGLLWVQQFSVLPEPHILLLGFIPLGFIVWRRYWQCLWFSIGLIWGLGFAWFKLTDQLAKNLEGIETPVTGYIANLPEYGEKHVRFNFVITQSKVQLPNRVRLSWYNVKQPIKAGQHWAFTVKLKRPHGSLNQGGFDYERWLFTENIGATGSVRAHPNPVLLGQDATWNHPAIWRQTIADQLTEALANKPNLALIKALTIGDGSSISQSNWDIFRKTGTTHLFVISGSHIGLIAGLLYWLVLKVWVRTGILRYSPPTVAASMAIIVAILYSAVAGFTIPTQRAMIMFSFAMVTVILQRQQRPFNTLATAMLLILIVDPLAVLSIGFWLSFLAVGLIIYSVAGRLRTPKPIISALKINWATSLGLAPLLLVFFQQVSLIAPFANFIAVPVVGLLIVPTALFATVSLAISSTLASSLFWMIDKTLQGLLWLLAQLAAVPISTYNHAAPSPWLLVFAVPAVLLLLAPVGIPGRSLGLIMLLPLLWTKNPILKNGHFEMTVLDVGQGLAVTVQTAHHCLIYDTGPKYPSGSDSGQTVVLPFLRQQQIQHIDTLLISHSDNDHSGGAETVLASVPIDTLMTSAIQQMKSHNPIACRAGQSWIWDDVVFTMLAPNPLWSSQSVISDNNQSCVLRISNKQTSVLLTGDIEAEVEQQLLNSDAEKLKADILLAPHHGSKTSSTVAFLQKVQPHTIIIPAGYLNAFGHPHSDVLARYQNLKATIFNTANDGAITVTTQEMGFIIRRYRDSAGKYWNNKFNR